MSICASIQARVSPDVACPITVLTGATGSGKTLACLSISVAQRVVCLPTRLSIVAMSRYARGLNVKSTESISCVFFEAGDEEGGAEISKRGDDEFSDFVGCTRAEALKADLVFVTPYQMRVQRFRADAVYIVDEAHECAADRLATISAVALRNDPLVLASATPPLWLTGDELFGRPLEVYELTGARKRVRAVKTWSAETRGVTLHVHGSIAMAAKGVARERGGTTALITGETPSGDLPRILEEIAAGAVTSVHATVGMCASAITIPGVSRIQVHESALKARSYRPGRADAQSGPLTASELVQILGRCARSCDVGEALIGNNPVESPWLGAWSDVVASLALPLAPELTLLRRQNFAALMPLLGNALDAETALAVCVLLRTAPTLIAYCRACYAALSTFVGCDFRSWATALPAERAEELRFGGDFGRVEKASERGPAAFFRTHRAFRDAAERPLEPTLALRVGLLLTLGPGFAGAWTAARAECPDGADFEALVDEVPATAELIERSCTLDGREMSGEFPRIGAASIAEREAALVAGAVRKTVPAGVPMGSRANGSIVNALTSLAALAARAALIAAQKAPIRCATGGDDIISEHEAVATEVLAIMETATQRKENEQKTRVVEWDRAYAVVLERYWRRVGGRPTEFIPTPCLSRVKSIVKLLNGGAAPEDAVVDRACRLALGCSVSEWTAHKASHIVDTQMPKLRTGLRAPPARHETVVRVSNVLLASITGPTFAGRDGGEDVHLVRRRVQDLEASARAKREAPPLGGVRRSQTERPAFEITVPVAYFEKDEVADLAEPDIDDARRAHLCRKLRALTKLEPTDDDDLAQEPTGEEPDYDQDAVMFDTDDES